MHENNVLICSLVCRRTAYVLDLFLANQQEIHRVYPKCYLVLATDESDFILELKELITRYNLNGEVIFYETIKPDYAKHRVWSIACGREKLRQFAISKNAEFMLFLDSDMTFDPQVVNILMPIIQGFDAVYSGYILRKNRTWGFATGCLLMKRSAFSRIDFRCYEFKNGDTICEDELLDMDLFRIRARVHKGLFLSIKHFRTKEEFFVIKAGPVPRFRKLTSNLMIRYILLITSIRFKHNIASWLYKILIPYFRYKLDHREETPNL